MNGAPEAVLPSQDKETTMASDWPLRDSIELGALTSAVPCARLRARQVLWEWGLDRLSDDIELVVSELVTNAVQASGSLKQATPVRIWLLSDQAQILVLVWDASEQPPIRMDAGQEADGGRGLLLVEGISARWGWYATQEPGGGKVVWAVLR
jgi:anti-sigma regulatory factor (Ser/Thr protein kinase)